MDWFEKLTGFKESDYQETRALLEVNQGRLRSRVNNTTYGIGVLELASLQSLRERAMIDTAPLGQLRVSIVSGDVRRMHRSEENAGALFQVASQFNLLEISSPEISPEDGVIRYQNDHTQGPACALAAGAATIYRNYFVPVGDQCGQTAKQQLNGLADLGIALSGILILLCHKALVRFESDCLRMAIHVRRGGSWAFHQTDATANHALIPMSRL